MIQRIQSLFLFLTTLLSLLFLKGSFLSFINKTGDVIKFTFTEIVKSPEGQDPELIQKVLPFSIVLILVAVLSLVTIFCFKKRNIQLMLSKLLIAVITGLVLISVYYAYMIITKYGGEIVPGVKMVVPVVMLILSILAFHGIRKDDQLVKSYDRLR